MEFAAWADEFERVELPVDGVALSTALALRSRLEALITATAGTFDGLEMWDEDGSTSMTSWLKARGLNAGDAGSMASSGKKLRSLPVLRQAWVEGALSLGQIKTVMANVRDKHVDLFATHEEWLVPSLVGLSVADTLVAMTDWRLKAEALDEFDPPGMPHREKHLSQTLDGRWHESGAYDPEGGALIDTALRLVMDGQSEEERALPAPERRGNAMVDVCRWFLNNQNLTNPGRRNRPHLHVEISSITDNHVTGELAEQRLPLDSPTLERMLCDCDLHRIVIDQLGALLDYGLGERSVPPNLWRALVARDKKCRFPGCDRPPTWCEGHHVQWFTRGGPTNLTNLVMLCSRHHHMLHQRGWDAVLQPDGELVITMPDGRCLRSYPPPRARSLVAA